MTRQHFNDLAIVLKTARHLFTEDQFRDLVYLMSDFCMRNKKKTTRFSHELFQRACGLEG